MLSLQKVKEKFEHDVLSKAYQDQQKVVFKRKLFFVKTSALKPSITLDLDSLFCVSDNFRMDRCL